MRRLTPARYRNLKSGRYKLVYLGDLSLKADQGWKIAVHLETENGSLTTHDFRIEALPDLRIGQTFVDGTAEPLAAGELCSVRFPSKDKWRTAKAAQALPKRLWRLHSQAELCRQNVFVFTAGNREFVIPVLELARALLLSKKIFCRYLLSPSGLGELALVRRDSPEPGSAEIRFRPDAPLYLAEELDTREHFAWMMLHPEPGRLFGSIYGRFMAQRNQSDLGPAKRFVLDMDFPDFHGVEIQYSGPSLGNTVFVREILSFSGLPHSGYKAVFIHPAKRTPVQGEGGGTLPSLRIPEPEDVEIDEQDDNTNTSSRSRFVHVRPVKHAYVAQQETRIGSVGQYGDPGRQKGDAKAYEAPGTAPGSLGDPLWGHASQSVEYSDVVISNHDRTGGLDLFRKVATELAEGKSWSLRMEYFELPSVSQTSFRLLGDRPRQAGLASYGLPEGRTLHLLEVQISDGRHLSTLALRPLVAMQEREHLDTVKLLLRALVKDRGSWNRSVLKLLSVGPARVEASRIRHPKELFRWDEREAVQVWLAKLARHIDKLVHDAG